MNSIDAKGRFATKEELVELQKAMTTAGGSAGDIIEPEIDPRLQNMVVQRYPFYMWLMSMGMITSTKSAKPSFLKKVSGGAGSFIAEAAPLPGGTDSIYDLETGTMTTWVHPIEISDRMIKGSKDSIVEVLDQEIQDALLNNLGAINNGMLVGDGSSNSITGLNSLITTNVDDLGGSTEITKKFQLDDMVNTIFKEGGAPSALVTDGNTKSQIEEILYPNVQVIPSMETIFGYQATKYNSPVGIIPIIVDPGMSTTVDEQEIIFPDYSTLMLKYLQEPIVVDLAKTKLTESSVVTSDQSFMCRAEEFNGKIINIKTKTS